MDKLTTMRFFLLPLFLLISYMVMGQSPIKPVVYDIIYKGSDIGDLLATKEEKDGSVIYRIETDINKRILHVKKCHYDLMAEYVDGKLHESDYELYINDKLDKWVKVQDTGGKMVGSKNGKNSVDLGQSITYSSSMFFFVEPKGVSSTFSESNMKTRSVAPDPKTPGRYLLDKNKGSYEYQNGQLMKVTMDDVVKMEMVRRQ